MGNDLRDDRFVFFFRILFVENAVLLFMQANASETIPASYAKLAVEHIRCALPALEAKEYLKCIRATAHGLVHLLGMQTPETVVPAVFCLVHSVAMTHAFCLADKR